MPICILACITVVYVYFRRNTNHLFRKSVKRYSARFTLFLSAREILTNAKLCNLMEITTKTGWNFRLPNSPKDFWPTNVVQANSFPSANFAWFSDSYNQLYPLLFLLRREVVYHTTPYLSSHPPGQSELSVGNASAPHSYRSQAVCDFLWRIPSADTSLSERNSEMIGVYSQRLTHESLRIGSTNSINGSTFRTEMTGIILFFTGFRCRISYFS